MRFVYIPLVLLLSITFSDTVNWEHMYDYSTHDELLGVCEGLNRGFLAVGGSWDVSRAASGQLLLKYTTRGIIEWMDFYQAAGQSGTFAFDAYTNHAENEYLVVGTCDWAPGYTPDVLLTRYDINGNRLETHIYENYGIGTSISMTSEGDIVLGCIKPNNHARVIMVDGDDLSNVLWVYDEPFFPLAENWMRVYTDVTPYDEILFGWTSEAVWWPLYEKWAHGCGIYILDTNGNRTDVISLTPYLLLNSSSILAGFDCQPSSILGRSDLVVSVFYDDPWLMDPRDPTVNSDGAISLTCWAISSGNASNTGYVFPVDVRTEGAFTNGLFSAVNGTIFECNTLRNVLYLAGIRCAWSSEYFIQAFNKSGTLQAEDVYISPYDVIRGPEFHMGDCALGDYSGDSYFIAMSTGNSSSSNCFVRYHTNVPKGYLDNQNENTLLDISIINNTSSNPVVAFQSSGGDYTIDIFDISGRCVQSITGYTNHEELVNAAICNTSSLVNGTYFAKVHTGNLINTVKVVVIQ